MYEKSFEMCLLMRSLIILRPCVVDRELKSSYLLAFISCSHLEMFLNIVLNPGIFSLSELDGMVINSSIC